MIRVPAIALAAASLAAAAWSQEDVRATGQEVKQTILEEHLLYDLRAYEAEGVDFERFDGAGYSLDLSSSIPIAERLTNGTLLVRFRTETNSPRATLFSLSDLEHPTCAFFLGLNQTGALCYDNRSAAGAVVQRCAGFGFHNGEWHTAALTVSGREGTRMYVDGELLARIPGTNFLDLVERPTDMHIGRTVLARDPASVWWFEGDVDWAEIHREVFDAAKIRARSDPPGRRRFARGYGIPMVDISADEDRRTVVDRERGQYLGHASTVLLDDQRTILAAYPAGHGRGRMIWKTSGDLGRSWSERLPVPAGFQLEEVPTLHPVDGRVLLITGVPRGDGGFRTAWLDLADDGSLPADPRWSEPRTHHAGRSVYGWVAGSSLVRLRDGGQPVAKWLMLFHDGWGHNWKTTLGFEGGAETWSEPRRYLPLHTAARAKGRVGPYLCEPGAIRSPDGRIIAVLYRAENRLSESMISFSASEGERFSDPLETPASLTGDRHMCRYDPVSGRVVVTFRDRSLVRHTLDSGDWVAWVGTFEDLVRGRPGQYRVRLMDNKESWDCGYAGIEVCDRPGHRDHGTFVLTSYGHWDAGEEPYIVSVRFKLAELDRLVE